MKRREWTAKQKLQIVLDGLKNQVTVSDLCSQYSITQGQYYKWRDQLLNNGEKAFESNPEKALDAAKNENHRLKSIIGTLTVELKKNRTRTVLKRSRSQSRIVLDQPILDRIVDIKKDHPNWGYRRVWAYIRYRDGVVVGKNRIYRLMSEAKKLVPVNAQLKASRTAHRSTPRASVPN